MTSSRLLLPIAVGREPVRLEAARKPIPPRASISRRQLKCPQEAPPTVPLLNGLRRGAYSVISLRFRLAAAAQPRAAPIKRTMMPSSGKWSRG